MDLSQYGKWLGWILSNFNLSMFILAVIFILFHPIINRNLSITEIIYRWMAFFVLGCTSLYTFVMHAFFSDIAASTIGWQTSPFQFEVAIANLAFGILGILSFKASYGFRLATVIASVVWFWGDAIGHIYQMIKNKNFSPGNAGVWFWFDLFFPLILILLIVRLNPRR